MISCNVQGLCLYWIWKGQNSDIGLEPWNEDEKSQHKFQISTSCGESHIKFTCNKNGLQRTLKLSKTMKTLYYSKGKRSSDIKAPLKNASTDQTFLILVDPKIEDKSGLISAQNHADLSLENKKMLDYSSSILKYESKCGKSGAYLNMIGSIREPIRENPVVEFSNESEISEEEDLGGNLLETKNNDKNLYTWNTTDRIQIDEKTSQAVDLKLALENIEKHFQLKLESKICKAKNDFKAESIAAINQMKIEIQNHFKLKLEQETEELKTENTTRLVKVTEKLDEAKNEIATLKTVVSEMKTHCKDLQLKQKDLEQDLKNCHHYIPLDIPKYFIKKEIVFDDMTIHFEENETSGLKRKLPSMESPPKKKSCFEVQNEDLISRRLRKISRQEEAKGKIMATKTLKEYWNVKALLIEELKKDFRQSKILKLNVNGQRAPLDTCGYYQQKLCKDLGLKHLQGNRKNMLRYHICDFCYELLNQANLHAAAECTIFRELDDELKDYHIHARVDK